ncbi:serine/threonine protein kinase [Salpingoeca rosetta]|uniref:Serine/threonine protein kinase n=1 Tax=Salpingoeca rosetta (strain ATCC 50818 / BSB-021) TaxID=946362 RepID=F2UEJ7_SALR5|nr:serine/threonine protein kinase [Salpingoeca rosetta]EGD75047.1 serine/threonine protein kinase [Salpingoeca rosetta]|eukprot:XP_004992100.1 serine/threonine protein kinase [Salpingoeca rosetta]
MEATATYSTRQTRAAACFPHHEINDQDNAGRRPPCHHVADSTMHSSVAAGGETQEEEDENEEQEPGVVRTPTGDDSPSDRSIESELVPSHGNQPRYHRPLNRVARFPDEERDAQQQQQHWLQEQQQEQLGRKERQVHKEEEVCHAVAVTAPKTVITSITQHGMHGLTVLRPPRRRGAVASPEKTPTEDQDIHRQTHARHTPDHRPEHQQRHTSSREETANRAQVVVAVNVTDGRSGDGAATRNPYMCDGAPDQDADVDEGQGVGEQQRPQSNGPLVREQAVPDVHRRCSCKQSGCARDERSRGQEAETPCVADEEDTSVRISEDSAATVAESGRRRKKKRSKKSKGDKSKKKGEKGPLKIGGRRTAVAAHPLVLPRPSPATTKKMTTDEALRQRGLQRQRLLGAGTFGDVFLVRTRDGAHRTDSPSYSDTSMSTASSPSVGPCINNSSVVAGGGGAGGVDGSMVFALKIMPKTADEAFLDAVREEALIGFQLNHPHIVRAFEMFETRHSICLLLEAGEAGDLYDAVHSGAFDCGYAGHTSQVLLQVIVLSGLEFLHRNKQLVHCDIKCENIVLTPTHKAKICDLGTCRRVGHVQTIVNGTPEYLSPELVEVFYTHPDLRQPYTITPAIDLWAFGVLCFFVLTHEKPWTFAHPDNDRFRDAIIECTHVHRPWATFDATLIRFFATLLVLDASKRPAHEDIRAMIKDDWANVCRHWRSIHAVTYV